MPCFFLDLKYTKLFYIQRVLHLPVSCLDLCGSRRPHGGMPILGGVGGIKITLFYKINKYIIHSWFKMTKHLPSPKTLHVSELPHWELFRGHSEVTAVWSARDSGKGHTCTLTFILTLKSRSHRSWSPISSVWTSQAERILHLQVCTVSALSPPSLLETSTDQDISLALGTLQKLCEKGKCSQLAALPAGLSEASGKWCQAWWLDITTSTVTLGDGVTQCVPPPQGPQPHGLHCFHQGHEAWLCRCNNRRASCSWWIAAGDRGIGVGLGADLLWEA